MSIIAMRWAYSRPIKNPVSKNVLVFLSSHNFPGNQSFFKIRTICAATGFSERAVRAALNDLSKDKYILKEPIFNQKGQQLSNRYSLNIDHDYLRKFYEEYENLPILQGGVGAGGAPTPLQEVHPYNNNIYNNIYNNNNGNREVYVKKSMDNFSKTCAKFVSRDTTSAEYKNAKYGNPEAAVNAMKLLPKFLIPARYRKKQEGNENE